MRAFLAGVFCVLLINVFSEEPVDVKLAIRNGALGRYSYRVVDDEGDSVPGVQAHVWFRSYGRPQDKADWIVETDANGMFTVEHRFNEKFSVGFDKEGYYHSHDEINYLAMTELPVKDGKWQPYGEFRTVVLKRIRNPIELSSSDGLSYYKYPPFGKWTGFDLCMRDWVYPDGDGKSSDVQIRIDRIATSKGYVKTMDVAFTNNPFGGAYEIPVDSLFYSPAVYSADTNAAYSGIFRYTYRKGERGNERKELEEGKGLVFRTRTTCDERGKLISAHYGVILGNWRFFEKGGMAIERILFNPTANDSNVEDVKIGR